MAVAPLRHGVINVTDSLIRHGEIKIFVLYCRLVCHV